MNHRREYNAAMENIGIDEAQTRLPELIESVSRGHEIVITRDQRAVARLMGPEASGAIPSLRDLKPVSVGKLLEPLGGLDDLLDRMLHP